MDKLGIDFHTGHRGEAVVAAFITSSRGIKSTSQTEWQPITELSRSSHSPAQKLPQSHKNFEVATTVAIGLRGQV